MERKFDDERAKQIGYRGLLSEASNAQS
jgi:hypothetical protein